VARLIMGLDIGFWQYYWVKILRLTNTMWSF